MRNLNHPNVIRLHEVFETDNSLYMILDILEGGNLMEKIKKGEIEKQRDIPNIIEGILRGVEHIHQKKIMHRDLKPENILFRRDTQIFNIQDICIADFGLSTFEYENEYLFSRCGTPGYVAPEIINLKNKNDTYNNVCDIFSVGVIFHFMLFGKSLFGGKTYNEVLTKNKACAINYNDIIYEVLHPAKPNPEKRFSATQCLSHEFFKIRQIKKKELIKVLDDDLEFNLKEDDTNEGTNTLYSHISSLNKEFNMEKINSLTMSPVGTPTKIKKFDLVNDSKYINSSKFNNENTPKYTDKLEENIVDRELAFKMKTTIFTGHIGGEEYDDNEMLQSKELISPDLKKNLQGKPGNISKFKEYNESPTLKKELQNENNFNLKLNKAD